MIARPRLWHRTEPGSSARATCVGGWSVRPGARCLVLGGARPPEVRHQKDRLPRGKARRRAGSYARVRPTRRKTHAAQIGVSV